MPTLALRRAPVALALASFAGSYAACADDAPHLPAPATLGARLDDDAAPRHVVPPTPLDQQDLRLAEHALTGRLRFLGAAPGRSLPRPADLAADATPEALARAHLATFGAQFGLGDGPGELALMHLEAGADGRAAVRFQQRATYRDEDGAAYAVPIVGAELIVGLDADGNLLSIAGELLPDAGAPLAPPQWAASDAVAVALAAVDVHTGLTSGASQLAAAPDLWVLDPRLVGGPGPRFPRLVWRCLVAVPDRPDATRVVFVDARDGGLALVYALNPHVRDRETYDAANAWTPTLACSEASLLNTCSGGDVDVIAGHVFAGTSYDFYAATHGRDSYDGTGATVRTVVNWGVNQPTAFWDTLAERMVFGDAYPFVQCEDIVGHELTHGVTQKTSRLFPYYQAGAIAESFSDLWGELIDQANTSTIVPENDGASARWKVGEQIVGVPSLVRRMDRPDLQTPPAPDRMGSPDYQCGDDLWAWDDNGGIHHNLSVASKAATLMIDGGTFNNTTVLGLGPQRTIALFYEAQTHGLTSGSDYADLCLALHQACVVLGYGAFECQQVRAALDATEMCSTPRRCEPATVAACEPGEYPADVFFDDFEGTTPRWVASSTVWQAPPTGDPSPYAASGVGSAWTRLLHTGTNDAMLTTIQPIVVPPNGRLHFRHAYGHDGAFDGGVVEYRPVGAGAWIDAGPLFTHGGYNGTLVLTQLNPLASPNPPARPAFIADSWGYGESRLDLSSLAGQAIELRFHIGTDLARFDIGWFVDDVRVYACQPTTAACTSQATTASLGSGAWTNPATWSAGVVPGPGDIVHIGPSAIVTAPSAPITIRGLCNEGTLLGAPSAPLFLEATELISNDGNIFAADGADGSGPSAGAWIQPEDGRALRLQTRTFHAGPTSDIQAGRGGHAFSYQFFNGQTINVEGGDGGRVEVHAEHLHNAGRIGPDPIVNQVVVPPLGDDGGNGGVADQVGPGGPNQGSATGGRGGDTIVIATQTAYNAATGQICSGNGGWANAAGQSAAVSGLGGTLVFSAPVTSNAGLLCAGVSGTVWFDPTLAILGDKARIAHARDIVIAGGDAWTLTLDGLAPGAIEASRDITLALGAGGVVDFGAADEPVLVAGGRVTVAADHVLADAGLERVIAAAELATTGPTLLRHALLTGPDRIAARPGERVVVPLLLVNNSPAVDTFDLAITGADARVATLPTTALVGALASARLDLVVTMPARGGLALAVQARSRASHTLTAATTVTLVPAGK